MRKLLLIAATAAMIGGPALAETQALKVTTAQTNFTDRAQVKQLYSRLYAAAERVCRTDIEQQYAVKADQACVDEAVASAVHRVDQPRLTAMLPANRTSLTASDAR